MNHGTMEAGGEVIISSCWAFNTGLIHGDNGVTLDVGHIMNQGIISAGNVIGPLLEGTLLGAIQSPLGYFEFLIMLIIAFRKLYGGSNEIVSAISDPISNLPPSVETSPNETDWFSKTATETTTTTLSNTTFISNSSMSFGDHYTILILICFLVFFHKF